MITHLPTATMRPKQSQRMHVHAQTMRSARLEIAIYDALRAGHRTARDIAAQIDADEPRVRALLRRMHLEELVERALPAHPDAPGKRSRYTYQINDV